MAHVIKIEWTDTAKHALRNIYEFHAEQSEESAFKVVMSIVEKSRFNYLSQTISDGRYQPELSQNCGWKLQGFVYGSRFDCLRDECFSDKIRLEEIEEALSNQK